MKNDARYIDKKFLNINSLKSDMIITAYTGFGEKYHSMDENTCKFIQHNFKNTGIIIQRGEKKIEVSADEVRVGDRLIRIFNFPPPLKKFTIVTPKLIKALRYRQIIQFDVKKKITLADDSKRDLLEIIQMVELSTKKLTRKEEKRMEAVRETNELVQKVNEGLKVRQNASNTVENIMDNARRGNTNIDDIRNYVDNITQNSSADAMAAIASLKASDQTYTHCVDVGVIFQTTYYNIIQETGRTSIFKSLNQAILSAFLHDFGKAKIPKDILDSTLRFDRDSKEMEIIKSHPTYGAELLAKMNMPDSIINMAHYHHVKMDPAMLSSYPEGSKYENVYFETRLLSIVDAYQALVGRRRYKRSWSPPATMRYIDALSGVEYDLELWELFLKTMGLYPKGSVVELSNNAIGFVVSVPHNGDDPERPVVAVVRNEYGEDLEHHELVDLQIERDLSILKDLDNQEIFGNNALEVFMQIEVS